MKGSTANASLSANYHPIAATTAASRLMESIIQQRIQCYLTSAPSQFGFNAKNGCDMTFFALKETAKCIVKSESFK